MIMRLLNKHILLGLLSFTAIACVNEEFVPEVEETVGEKMTFVASLENDSETKTTLGEKDEFGHRKLLWAPEDSIGITNGEYTINKFVNTSSEVSEKGIFEGTVGDGMTYYAIYPYRAHNPMEPSKSSWYYSDSSFWIDLPSTQKYSENSFASDMNIMVAKAEMSEELHFMNIFGILVINLSGDETVTSISISAKDENGKAAKLSGWHHVRMDYSEAPELTPNPDASTSLTIDCGEGVALNRSQSTSFYALMPPGTYNNLLLTISTADGKVMLKRGKAPLTINRARYISTRNLEFAAEVAFDLSEQGTANCYIVNEAGLYSFDASTIGNGEFGLTQTSDPMMSYGFHTTDATIVPTSAEIVWDDRRGAIGGLTFDPEKKVVNFVATGEEGNAVIAVRGANGKILWSWHIWATDQPAEHYYMNSNGNFTVLDRNIGAIRADAGSNDSERYESIGAMYQWGRKDPFMADHNTLTVFYNKVNAQLTTAESIQMSDTFAYGNGNWNKDGSGFLWSNSSKTIYDPCPAGYRVANKEVFTGFTSTGGSVDRTSNINFNGSYINGFWLKYDGSNTAWYPGASYISYWGDFDNYSSDNHNWTSTANLSFWYEYRDEFGSIMDPGNHWDDNTLAFPVRCMKDEMTTSLIAKINKVQNVEATSATATGKIAVYGDLEVLEAGFVFGTSADLDITNGTKVTTSDRKGVITADIVSLTPMTRYYIRSFASTASGTTYSEVISFYTPNTEGVVNLSADGTANSYIVPPVFSTYTFDAVKGNSDEAIENIAEALVLWETYNNSETVIQNSVIGSAEYSNGKVKFAMPFEPREGNAVIAVKDVYGTILWSWHIWVTGYDPVSTQQKYISGATMMDRNLGALTIADYDPRTYGLVYQWGRKDPFVGAVDSWNLATTYPDNTKSYATDIYDYNYSISNPTVSLVDVNWNSDKNLWSSEKTIYDPCPAGWRVPDQNAWSGIPTWDYGYWGNGGSLSKIDAPYSEPEAYYYCGGWIGSYRDLNEFNISSMCHTTTPAQDSYTYAMRIHDSFNNYHSIWKDYLIPVRCMKETDVNSGDNEGYTESDDYEW